MRHTLKARAMGEGHLGLFEIYYLKDNRAQSPISVVREITKKWADRFVNAYNDNPDLFEKLEEINSLCRENRVYNGTRVQMSHAISYFKRTIKPLIEKPRP